MDPLLTIQPIGHTIFFKHTLRNHCLPNLISRQKMPYFADREIDSLRGHV